MELVIFRVIQDRRRHDDAGGASGIIKSLPRSELLPVLNFVTMHGLVGPILGPVLGGVLVTGQLALDFPH